jgi:hypothetical protein
MFKHFPLEAECLPELQLELEFPALLWFQRVLRVLAAPV